MAKFLIPIAALALGAAGVSSIDYVTLQPGTNGPADNGNLNITGRAIASHVQAGDPGGAPPAYVPLITAYAPEGSVMDGIRIGANGNGLYCSSIGANTYGGYFECYGNTATALIVRHAGSGTGNNIAFSASSPGSDGTAGYFESTTATGAATVISGVLQSSSGAATAARLDGKHGYGAIIRADETNGYGAFMSGSSTGTYTISANGRGIYANSSNKNSYGVYGAVAAGGTGNAVYAQGNMAASGTKALMIDHPDDPTGKYLKQYCAEGDTPQLQYRGTVKLDASGSAYVTLPSYFEEINRDPSYQLTAIGAPMPNLYLAEKVRKNRFKIAGGKSGAEVSWTVIGIRNDLFVKKYGAPTEVEKPREAQGTYVQPELYGQPKEMAESYSEKAALQEGQHQAQRKPDARK